MGPYSTGADPLRDGRRAALQQGVHPQHVGHPVARQVRNGISRRWSLGPGSGRSRCRTRSSTAMRRPASRRRRSPSVTSKFPSAEDMSKGMRDVAEKRGLKEVPFLEYETRQSRLRPDRSAHQGSQSRFHVRRLSRRRRQPALEAMNKIDYTPKRHFYLYPAPVLAGYAPAAERATSLPISRMWHRSSPRPRRAEFAKAFDAKAVEAKLPYPHVDSQAGNEYCGWQILVAAVNATKSIEDAKMADCSRRNRRNHRRQAQLQGSQPHQRDGPAADPPGAERQLGFGVPRKWRRRAQNCSRPDTPRMRSAIESQTKRGRKKMAFGKRLCAAI